MKNEELTRLRKKLEHWNYDTISMAMLSKEESAVIIELIEKRESRVKYQRKKYLERVQNG